MIVHIENELDCPLEFHWEYETNKGKEMLYAAKILSKTKSIIYGNFVSFHEGPYIRPSSLKLVSWKDRKILLPWELKKNHVSGAFKDCIGKNVKYEITEKGKELIKLRFFN